MNFIRQAFAAQERLKKRIHSIRIPLGPVGIVVMGCVYFSIPLVGGFYVMDWAQGKADKKWEQMLAQQENKEKYVAQTEIPPELQKIFEDIAKEKEKRKGVS